MPAVLAEPELPIVELPLRPVTGGPGGGGPRDFEPGGDGGGGDDGEPLGGNPSGGPSAGMIGIIATLVSITALFATILIAYMVRARTQAHWQPVAIPHYLWFSTVLIVASSVTLEGAKRAFDRFDAVRYGRWLVGTFFIALAFIVSQALALRELLDRGIYLRNNPHSSLFYVITGVHAVHVFGGLAALFYLIYRVARGTPDLRASFAVQRNTMSVTQVYWHFLDLLWVALFLVLLLWK